MAETVQFITTRFTDDTFKQNQRFRDAQGWKGSLYGCKCEFGLGLTDNNHVFVLEMNNDINKIIGIGYISCRPLERRFKIYNPRGNHGDDAGHNRIVYSGKRRWALDDLPLWVRQYLAIMEPFIFSQHYRVMVPFTGASCPMAIHPSQANEARRYYEISQWRETSDGVFSVCFEAQDGLWGTHWVDGVPLSQLADSFRGRHIKNRMGMCRLPRIFQTLPSLIRLQQKLANYLSSTFSPKLSVLTRSTRHLAPSADMTHPE